LFITTTSDASIEDVHSHDHDHDKHDDDDSNVSDSDDGVDDDESAASDTDNEWGTIQDDNENDSWQSDGDF